MNAVERPVERVKMVTRVTTHEQPIVQNVCQPVQIVIEVYMFTHTNTREVYIFTHTHTRKKGYPYDKTNWRPNKPLSNTSPIN